MLVAGQSFFWQSALFWRRRCTALRYSSHVMHGSLESWAPYIHFNDFFAGSRCFPLQSALLKIPTASRHTEGKMVVSLLLTREDKFHPEPQGLFVFLLFVTCCLPRPFLLSSEIANVKKACTAWLWQTTSWRLQWSECSRRSAKKKDK